MSSGLKKGLTNYGDERFALFLRKAFIKAMGYSDDALDRPIVGITNTHSDYNPCHGNVPDLIEAIQRGAMLAGAMPFVFPTMSIHESFAHPTSMYLRNLMAMETEEMIRAQPMDAVVLIGGCDKTIPAQIMAALSVDLPAIVLPTGPMLTGSHRGEVIGACTDCRRMWGKFRAGEIQEAEIEQVNGRLVPSIGTCGVMGTASTMACVTEALGLSLPGSATAPAVSAARRRIAEATGKRAAEMARTGAPRPSEIVTDKAIRNAFAILHAIGGSTNALVHLAAIVGRLGKKIDYEAFDKMSREVPVLVDLKPSGSRYMQQFDEAGGVPRLMKEMRGLLATDALTVGGGTIADAMAAGEDFQGQDVIRSRSNPISNEGALAVLRGNLAPRGAVIKQSAASKELLQHTGRAVVFENVEDMAARIDDPDLDVGPDDVLVLRNTGPRGAPGMPEAGYLPIPKKLLQAGVKDMVRISDARMSGTAFGTIVLHVAPESAVGGPLALVKNGDRIRLDVAARRIDLLVAEEELAKRARELRPKHPEPIRGYARLFQEHVTQADEGCDFDFLTGKAVPATTPSASSAAALEPR